MNIKTFTIPTTGYNIQLDQSAEFLTQMQDLTMPLNYSKRLELVNTLVSKFKPYADAFMNGKERVFVASKLSYYTVDEFLTDAAQCAYTNSTLPANMQVN